MSRRWTSASYVTIVFSYPVVSDYAGHGAFLDFKRCWIYLRDTVKVLWLNVVDRGIFVAGYTTSVFVQVYFSKGRHLK